MSSEAKPPILAAPLEIRFEIYRHVWMIPDSDLPRLLEACRQQSGRVHLYPEIYYFRHQVELLNALVSICRQIRDEVLSEYFHQTQVGVSNWRDHNPMLKEVLLLPLDMQHIQSSLLFVSYTQHVSLFWTAGESDLMTRALDWLLQLKQLKTLELIINWPSRHVESALNEILDSSLFERLTTLRNLEKIVVKLYGDSLEETPEIRRIEDILSKSVREDLRQVYCTPMKRVPRFFSHSLKDT
ncbi:hypothetical protein NEUTE1DRAFT_129453 [Neurospora tetrasperma FGSC 2508]|uniref:Uncharacterized protein n=1 Tax=Neurospora tetrasperma (strain FGSC 2508 / ATCC MYA-4615 / P0657) TaxID=510951 RepID=F8ML52_NEUT8|nr:uncharacterized protein NEUTE1DRAFT_129453 [Neurospora tetrasperma FGSC 2508]EGO57527.1 hypothetical protein NEUTE1DRAFT_129453 [Neurospora tetrasperma FGSC 2508]